MSVSKSTAAIEKDSKLLCSFVCLLGFLELGSCLNRGEGSPHGTKGVGFVDFVDDFPGAACHAARHMEGTTGAHGWLAV